MTREELLKGLKEISDNQQDSKTDFFDIESNHIKADALLLDFIKR